MEETHVGTGWTMVSCPICRCVPRRPRVVRARRGRRGAVGTGLGGRRGARAPRGRGARGGGGVLRSVRRSESRGARSRDHISLAKAAGHPARRHRRGRRHRAPAASGEDGAGNCRRVVLRRDGNTIAAFTPHGRAVVDALGSAGCRVTLVSEPLSPLQVRRRYRSGASLGEVVVAGAPLFAILVGALALLWVLTEWFAG